MFIEVPGSGAEYKHPWEEQPFEARLQALTARRIHIAYFYSQPDTSTFRYRVFNMVEALEATPELDVSAAWFSRSDMPCMRRVLDRADALVICRVQYDDAICDLIGSAKARGIRVLYDCDDLVFDSAYVHLVLNTLDQDTSTEATWDHWFAYFSRLGATARLCDRMIATNPFLAQRAKEYAPFLDCAIVPNFLNKRQQAYSERIWESKRRCRFRRNGQLHIGYFSGTPTHSKDFQVAEEAIVHALNEHPDVVLRIVGFLTPLGPLRQLNNRFEQIPLQDFVNLQRSIGEVEINVAPLQSNTFTNCKSELKFFEAAIAGTLTIASRTFVFENSISPGETGLLASGCEWIPAVEAAIEITRDWRHYEKMAEAAFDYVRVRYAWNRYGREIVAAVFGTPAEKLSQVRGPSGGTPQREIVCNKSA